MKKLSYDTLCENGYSGYLLEQAPERILQFGEGNFLRAFCDYFVDLLNERCGFNSKIVVCQPIAQGLSQLINDQQGLYTLYLRGFEIGEKVEQKRIISSISRCFNPYEDYQALLDCARNSALRYIISNTTEAGIVFDDGCHFEDAPPAAFPAKLTRFLYERYTAGLGGLVILSCELIDNNGAELLRCVRAYISLWALNAGFARWVEEENIFCSTLVDRIVTGYPRTEAAALNESNGYIDNLLVTAEVFGFWVIEAPDSLKDELPFEKAGLPVIITADHTPYKQRKVRILNGAHTAMVPAAYLSGQDIVRGCMEDRVIAAFMDKAIFEEIIPTLALPYQELESFAQSVSERFRNPFIDHALLSIAFNSTSKWRARVLPSLKGYISKFGRLPRCLTLSMAAYIELYCGNKRGDDCYEISDDVFVLDLFREHKNDPTAQLVPLILSNVKLWGEDLTTINGFAEAVEGYLSEIRATGMYETLKTVI